MAPMLGVEGRARASRKASLCTPGCPAERRASDPATPSLAAGSDEAELLGAHQGLRAARCAKLREHVADMPLRRTQRHGQAGRDVRVARTLGHEPEDVEFACRERLEALAGGHAIGRDGEALARSGRSEILASVLEARGTVTARDVGEAAAHGDAAATALLERSARYVGTTIAAIVNLFNPSMIVLGGGVPAVGDRYLASIRQTVYRRSLPLATRRLQIVPSGLGPMAGVVGAAAMVAGELFAREQLALTLARHAAPSPALDRADRPVPYAVPSTSTPGASSGAVKG